MNMNLPNKLSLLRIILIPVTLIFMLPISIYGFEPAGWNKFISEWGMIIAAVVFIIASLTDMFDGKIARKYNLITNMGKFLDALADKLLIISVMTALCYLGRISAWPLCIIIFREFMVTGIRLIASAQGIVIAAQMVGKVKTVTQMIAVIYIMFEPLLLRFFGMNHVYPLETSFITVIGDILLAACVLMTIISGIDYLKQNFNLLKESK